MLFDAWIKMGGVFGRYAHTPTSVATGQGAELQLIPDYQDFRYQKPSALPAVQDSKGTTWNLSDIQSLLSSNGPEASELEVMVRLAKNRISDEFRLVYDPNKQVDYETTAAVFAGPKRWAKMAQAAQQSAQNFATGQSLTGAAFSGGSALPNPKAGYLVGDVEGGAFGQHHFNQFWMIYNLKEYYDDLKMEGDHIKNDPARKFADDAAAVMTAAAVPMFAGGPLGMFGGAAMGSLMQKMQNKIANTIYENDALVDTVVTVGLSVAAAATAVAGAIGGIFTGGATAVAGFTASAAIMASLSAYKAARAYYSGGVKGAALAAVSAVPSIATGGLLNTQLSYTYEGGYGASVGVNLGGVNVGMDWSEEQGFGGSIGGGGASIGLGERGRVNAGLGGLGYGWDKQSGRTFSMNVGSVGNANGNVSAALTYGDNSGFGVSVSSSAAGAFGNTGVRGSTTGSWSRQGGVNNRYNLQGADYSKIQSDWKAYQQEQAASSVIDATNSTLPTQNLPFGMNVLNALTGWAGRRKDEFDDALGTIGDELGDFGGWVKDGVTALSNWIAGWSTDGGAAGGGQSPSTLQMAAQMLAGIAPGAVPFAGGGMGGVEWNSLDSVARDQLIQRATPGDVLYVDEYGNQHVVVAVAEGHNMIQVRLPGERRFEDLAIAAEGSVPPGASEEDHDKVFLAILKEAGLVQPGDRARANPVHMIRQMTQGHKDGYHSEDGSLSAWWREVKAMGRDAWRGMNLDHPLRTRLLGPSPMNQSANMAGDSGDREARLETYRLAYELFSKVPGGADPYYAESFLDGQRSGRLGRRVMVEGAAMVAPEGAVAAARAVPALRAFLASSRAMRARSEISAVDKALHAQREAEMVEAISQISRFSKYEPEDVQRIFRALSEAGVEDAQILRYLESGVMDYNGTRIAGLPQKTGTTGHAGKSMELAMDLAKSGDFDVIHLDRGYNSMIGQPGAISSNRRPDVTALTKWGSRYNIDSDKRLIMVREVISTSDDPAKLRARNLALEAQLEKKGFWILYKGVNP